MSFLLALVPESEHGMLEVGHDVLGCVVVLPDAQPRARHAVGGPLSCPQTERLGRNRDARFAPDFSAASTYR